MFSLASKIFFGLILLSGLAGFSLVLAVDGGQATTSAATGILPEKNLIEALCLNSQWRAQDFSGWVSAYAEFIVASSSKKFFKTDEKFDLLNPTQFQKETAAKLSAVCTSTSYSAALENFQGLVDFVKSVQGSLRAVDAVVEKNFQEQIDAVKSRIPAADKADLKNLIAQGKAKKETVLKQLVNSLAASFEQKLKDDLASRKFFSREDAKEYAGFVIKAQQEEIRKQAETFASQARSDLLLDESENLEDFLGNQYAGFSAVSEEIKQVGKDITDLQAAKTEGNGKVKSQALEKIKSLIAALLDSKLQGLKEQGFVQNKEAIEQLSRARQDFLNASQTALAVGDVAGLKAAIEEAQSSWNKARLLAPELKLTGNDLQEICSSAPAVLAMVKPQLAGMAEKIQSIEKASGKRTADCKKNPAIKDCLTFNEAIAHLSFLKSDLQNFSDSLTALADGCQSNDPAQGNVLKAANAAQKSGLKLQQNWASWKAKWPQYQQSL